MAGKISVIFPLRVNSAKSFDDLIGKAGVETSEEFMNAALGWYRKITGRFNDGCDILETNEAGTDCHYIDLFEESARARTVAQLSAELDPAVARLIQADFNSNNLHLIFMNAHYFYDRVLDTESRGYHIAASDPSANIMTIYRVGGRL